jgi:hypothetical protein
LTYVYIQNRVAMPITMFVIQGYAGNGLSSPY